jgi:hypothetical protein
MQTYDFSLLARGLIDFLLSFTYIRFMRAKILRALQLVFSKTTFLILAALAVVYSLWSVNLSLQRLVIRYDETRLLAARMTGLERDMNEFRGNLNTLSAIARSQLKETQQLQQDIYDRAIQFRGQK